VTIGTAGRRGILSGVNEKSYFSTGPSGLNKERVTILISKASTWFAEKGRRVLLRRRGRRAIIQQSKDRLRLRDRTEPGGSSRSSNILRQMTEKFSKRRAANLRGGILGGGEADHVVTNRKKEEIRERKKRTALLVGGREKSVFGKGVGKGEGK